MTIEAEFDFNPLVLDAFRDQLASRLKKETYTALNRIGVEFGTKMSARFRGTRSGCKNTSSRLVSRTGALERSIAYKVNGPELKVYAGGYGIPYARIQEFGGTITGRPWLTVPLPANYTSACNVRYPSARQLQITGATFVRKKGRRLIIYLKKTDGNVEALWELRRQVKIPKRLGFLRTWQSRGMRNVMRKRLTQAFGKALRDAGRAASVKGKVRTIG